MISQTSEYALRAVVHLARAEGERRTTEEIAASTSVPAPYLSKVLQALVRAGLVRSRRGRKGGFELARTPRNLSVYDVIEAVDPLQRIESCPLGLPEHSECLCALHQRIDAAIAAAEAAFRSTSMAELLADPGPQWPLGSTKVTGG